MDNFDYDNDNVDFMLELAEILHITQELKAQISMMIRWMDRMCTCCVDRGGSSVKDKKQAEKWSVVDDNIPIFSQDNLNLHDVGCNNL